MSTTPISWDDLPRRARARPESSVESAISAARARPTTEPVADARDASGEATFALKPPTRSPEQARRMMSAFQHGLRIGRLEAGASKSATPELAASTRTGESQQAPDTAFHFNVPPTLTAEVDRPVDSGKDS